MHYKIVFISIFFLLIGLANASVDRSQLDNKIISITNQDTENVLTIKEISIKSDFTTFEEIFEINTIQDYKINDLSLWEQIQGIFSNQDKDFIINSEIHKGNQSIDSVRWYEKYGEQWIPLEYGTITSGTHIYKLILTKKPEVW